MRVSKDDIIEVIEGFVNSIYDDENSDWKEASYESWLNATYEELIAENNIDRKFIGKQNLHNMIKPLLTERLQELKEEGYNIKAI